MHEMAFVLWSCKPPHTKNRPKRFRVSFFSEPTIRNCSLDCWLFRTTPRNPWTKVVIVIPCGGYIYFVFLYWFTDLLHYVNAFCGYKIDYIFYLENVATPSNIWSEKKTTNVIDCVSSINFFRMKIHFQLAIHLKVNFVCSNMNEQKEIKWNF